MINTTYQQESPFKGVSDRQVAPGVGDLGFKSHSTVFFSAPQLPLILLGHVRAA